MTLASRYSSWGAGQLSSKPPGLPTCSCSASVLLRRTPSTFSVNNTRLINKVLYLRCIEVVEGDLDGVAHPKLFHLELLYRHLHFNI